MADRISLSALTLNEAIVRSSVPIGDVALALGYTKPNWGSDGKVYGRVGDTTRLYRVLGLKPYQSGSTGKRSTAKTIDYDVALKIAEAIGVDPVDVGL